MIGANSALYCVVRDGLGQYWFEHEDGHRFPANPNEVKDRLGERCRIADGLALFASDVEVYRDMGLSEYYRHDHPQAEVVL